MDKGKYLKNYRIYIPWLIVFAVTLFFFPIEGKFKYNYQTGSPWMYGTLISPIDFPILKTQQELLKEKEEKASMVVPYFNYDDNVIAEQDREMRALQGKDSVDDRILYAIIGTLNEIYAVGISPLSSDALSNAGTIIVQRDRRASEIPSTEVYTVERAGLYLKWNITSAFPGVNVDSLLSAYNISKYIVPNLVYDQKKTDLLHKEAVDYISPTKGMVYAGQLIVSEGEIVTNEVSQLLDSFRAEYEQAYGYTESQAGLIAGHAVISLLILAALFAIIYFMDITIFTRRNEYNFILVLYLVMFIATVLLRNYDQKYLLMMPYAVFALYLTSFFKTRYVFPLYSVMMLHLLFLSQDGVELYIMNVMAGITILVSYKYFNKGWLQFVNSVCIFFALIITYLGFALSGDGSLSAAFAPGDLFMMVANSLFVVVAYPFVFIFERIFSLVSYSRLYDLSDTNSRLLRELSQKAPGTFQHSLQVANLAGEAARAIGADMMLARVGALYHDIGKMKNPQCFIENSAAGVDYHKGLSPIESAQEIIRHVDDGVEIARKYRLPDIVTDFIRTHHARTLTYYFYAEYCNGGGDPDNREPFTYHGELPTTKEQVAVMMADSVEAASRSLKSYSAESISEMVDAVTANKLNDSQLINADISIKDIARIKAVFKSRLEQVYHERIAYPSISGGKDAS